MPNGSLVIRVLDHKGLRSSLNSIHFAVGECTPIIIRIHDNHEMFMGSMSFSSSRFILSRFVPSPICRLPRINRQNRQSPGDLLYSLRMIAFGFPDCHMLLYLCIQICILDNVYAVGLRHIVPSHSMELLFAKSSLAMFHVGLSWLNVFQELNQSLHIRINM